MKRVDRRRTHILACAAVGSGRPATQLRRRFANMLWAHTPTRTRGWTRLRLLPLLALRSFEQREPQYLAIAVRPDQLARRCAPKANTETVCDAPVTPACLCIASPRAMHRSQSASSGCMHRFARRAKHSRRAALLGGMRVGQDRIGSGVAVLSGTHSMRRATRHSMGGLRWTAHTTQRRTGDVEYPPARLLQRTRHKPDVHTRYKPQVRQRVDRKRSICVVSGHACHCVLALERQVVCRSCVGLELDLAGLRTESESDLGPPRAAVAHPAPRVPLWPQCHPGSRC